MSRAFRGIVFSSLIFGVVGAFFIIIGFVTHRSTANFQRIAIETSAVITNIDIRGDTQRVYVMFNVDGQEYTSQVGYSRAGMAVGHVVPIFYHPNNPQNFRTTLDTTASIMFVVFGGFLILASVGYFYIRYKRYTYVHPLVTGGKKIMATFVELRLGPRSGHNIAGSNVICEYCDETTNNKYLFTSKHTWAWPYFHHRDQQIPLIPVYVDPNDYSKYYVALREYYNANLKWNSNISI